MHSLAGSAKPANFVYKQTPAIMIVIQALRQEESAAAKQLLREVWREYFGLDEDLFVRHYFDDPEVLKDLDDIEAAYFSQGGTILAASERGRIVATGAISR